MGILYNSQKKNNDQEKTPKADFNYKDVEVKKEGSVVRVIINGLSAVGTNAVDAMKNFIVKHGNKNK